MANKSTPLSSYLDAPVSQTNNVKRSGMKKKLWVGSLLLAFLPGLSTTLASSITINNSQSIEFGQGSQATAACDDSITVTIGTTWSQANSFFTASTLTLGDLNTTAGKCLNKTITVKALNSSGTEIDLNGAGTTGNALTHTVSSAGSATATQVLSVSGTVNSVDIARVTVETS